MNRTDAATIKEGSMVLPMELGVPWPPSRVMPMITYDLKDGTLQVFANTSGQLVAEISDTAGKTLQHVTSCKLIIDEPTAAIIRVGWKDGTLTLWSVDQIIGSNELILPPRFVLPKLNPTKNFDFTSENEAKIKHRRSRYKGAEGTPPKPNRIRSTDEQIFDALKSQLRQLADLIPLVLEGKREHHIESITNILRKTIAKGDPLPILQLCATILDAPIIIYTAANPRANFPDVGYRIQFDGSLLPRPLLSNPIDLDVWLDLEVCQLDGVRYTNRELIAKIGNTVASHFDLQIHPVVTGMKKTRKLNPVDIDALAKYILGLAAITLGVGGKILQSKKSRSL
jgi:hypothetical protein